MYTKCPMCGKKAEFKLSSKDVLFSLQDCTVCKVNFTQMIRNLEIVDGKITGEIAGTEEMFGADSNKGGEGYGKEKK